MEAIKVRYKVMKEEYFGPEVSMVITDFRHEKMKETADEVIRKLEPKYGKAVSERMKREEKADE
ncbi:MAG: hypothetical protein K5697_16960 [Lachnospiraceae bacterium]|nr:hypothetical protein [Lachnospiraceae bacterium]